MTTERLAAKSPICSHCQRPIIGRPARHFGTHIAHAESECLQILQAEIERLRAALAEHDAQPAAEPALKPRPIKLLYCCKCGRVKTDAVMGPCDECGNAEFVSQEKYASGARPSEPDPYQALLYAVSQKYPGETRHETALRYIRQAQAVKVSGSMKETP